MAAPVHDAGGATLGGTGFVFGGGRFGPGATVQVVRPSGPSVSIGRLPAVRADLAAVSGDGELIVVGGGTPTHYDKRVLATTDGLHFRTIARLLVGVRYPAVAALGGIVYVVGGSTAAGDSRDIQAVDPRTGVVRITGHLARGLSHAAALVIGANLLIAGGRAAGRAQDGVWRYDPAAATIGRVGRLPYPVSDMGAVAVDGIGYLIGGEDHRPLASIITSHGRRRGATRSHAHPRGRRTYPTVAVIALCVVGFAGLVGLGSVIGGQSERPAIPSRGLAVGGGSPVDSPIVAASVIPPSPSPMRTRAPLPSSPVPVPPATATNLYAGAGAGMFAPSVASFPPRVYVPDEANGRVVVIDPRTYKILFRYPVGASPEHVTPDWDLQRLYVEASLGGRLTVIDPLTGRPVGHHSVPGPYNLYFTLDGRMAIVVLDSRLSGAEYGGQKQLRFYDRRTWRLIKALDVPYAGADHLDFSADGSFFLLSTEYTGWLVKVDVKKMSIAKALHVGGNPIDVRLSPDGRVFYVANQGTNGVSVIDAVHIRQLAFLRTGRGAHGLAISRDARWLYVTNRLAGTLSVIDFAKRRVIHTWRIGGSPDMIAVSPDGTQLWISNRFGGTVSVVNAHTGQLIKRIRVGGRPHGLAYFPEPGRISIGHNGIYR